jgi:hypothetical protein
VQTAFWLLVNASKCQCHPPEMAGESPSMKAGE